MALDARESKVVEGTGLLEEELLRRNNELAALNAIAEAVSGSLDLDEVLNNALDKVLEITGFEAGGIGLVDEAQEIIVPTVYCGVPEAFLASLEQPRAGDGLRWRAVKSGESIFFEDIPHDPRIPKERRALVEGFYAAAYIPLKVKDRVVGLMGLGTRQEHRFTPENKVFLMTISNQIGIAIENARLYEATRQELAARKRAEEALRGRETFFSGTLNNLLTFIGVLEPDGKVIFVNNTPLDAAGIKVEDVIGKRFYDTYWWAHSEEARQTIRKDIERCASGETIVREIQAQMAGGSLMWVEFSMHPVYDEEGKVKYLVPEGRDITERKQAEEEVQRHLERLAALREIDRAITSTLDLSERLDIILRQLERVIPYTSAAIFLLTDDTAKVEAARGFPDPEQAVQVSFPVKDDALAQQLLEEKRPLVLADAQADDRFQAKGRTEYVRSWIGVPLIVRGETLGLLTIDHRESGVYDEESAEMALAFADQVAIAIENARLYEDLQERLEKEELLQEITRGLASQLDLAMVLRPMVEGAVRLVDGDAGTVALLDEKRGVLNYPYSHNMPPQIDELEMPQSSGLAGHLVRTKEEAVILKDYPAHPASEKEFVKAGVRSLLGVPLIVGERAVGALGVFTLGEHRRFTQEEARLLRAVADAAAIAIENSRLYEESKRYAQSMEEVSQRLLALQEISTKVAGTEELSEALRGVQENVTALFEEIYPPLFAIYHEDKEEMEIRGTSPDDPLVRKAKEVAGIELEGYKIPLSWLKRRPLQAMRRWAAFVSHDARNFIKEGIPKPVLRAAQKAMAIKCIAGIPLTARGRYIGAMIVSSRRERLSDEDLQVLAACANQAAIAIENAQAYQKLKAQNLEIISALAAAIEMKDPYTGGHSLEVTEMAVATAEKMGLSHDELENLRVAALLHDIGKIGIPDSVLNKPARLTSAERIMINSHPVTSAEIVGKIEALAHLVPIIRHHHEWYDGKGYPDGLKGEEIPLLARILAVADGFEAMTSERPYRWARTEEEALAELKKGAGSQWDPKVVEAFLSLQGAQR